MRTADRIMSILILLLGVYVLVTSWGLQYQLDDLPGPGFVPFWSGLGMVALSLIILAGTFPRRAGSDTRPFSRGSVRNMAASLGGCILMVALTGFTGLLVSLGLLTGFLARLWGTRSWVTTVLLAVILPVSLYLIFTVALSVSIPKGILGL